MVVAKVKRLLFLLLIPCMSWSQGTRGAFWQFDSTANPGAAANSVRTFTGKGDTLFAVRPGGDSVAIAPSRAGTGGATPDSVRAAGAVPWSGVTSKPDSFKNSWKADTLTGDVNLMKANDSLDVGGGDFTMGADGIARKVAGQATAGSGIAYVVGRIEHGDFVECAYTSDMDAETQNGGLTFWFIRTLGKASGSYNLTVSYDDPFAVSKVLATVDFGTASEFSGYFYHSGEATLSFFPSGNEYAFRAFTIGTSTNP